MARNLTTGQLDLLRSGALIRRMFFRLYNASTLGFWDGDYPVTLSGVDYGDVGEVPQMSSLQQVSDLSVPGFTINIPPDPNRSSSFWNKVIGDDNNWSQREVHVDLGLYSPATRQIVGPLLPWFRGYFDHIQINEEKDGGGAALVCTFESVARELNRSNPAVRSDSDQRDRDSGDRGMEYTAKMGDLELTWGNFEKKGKRHKKHDGGGHHHRHHGKKKRLFD